MGVIVLFMAALALYAGWWLSHQRLMAKPWLEEGVIGEFPGGDRLSAPPATIGLGVFLAVAGSLFALVMSAYVVRMQLLDWRPLPVPPLLWFNTGVLVLSSVILQCYYRDDRVMRSLGMEPRPPFPNGHEVEQGDWSLLDPVRKRPKLYREAP